MIQEDLWEIIKSMIRVGKVSSINEKECTARVLFMDKDELVTFDLPIIVPKTLKDKYYYMPDVDEHVLCLFLPNSIQQGFIIGAFYTEKYKDKIPFSDDEKQGARDKTKVKFFDECWFQYDRKEHIRDVHILSKHILEAKEAQLYFNSLKENTHSRIRNFHLSNSPDGTDTAELSDSSCWAVSVKISAISGGTCAGFSKQFAVTNGRFIPEEKEKQIPIMDKETAVDLEAKGWAAGATISGNKLTISVSGAAKWAASIEAVEVTS